MATEEPTPESTPEPSKPSLQPSPEQPQEFHCPKCGSVLTLIKTPTGISYRCPKCGRMVKPVERGGGEKVEEEEKGVAPLNVEAREFVVKELLDRLDSVYGIATRKVKPIAETVEDNPQIALNPTALYWHIKQLAGQANDYQLYLFISGLFNKLREKGLLAHPTPMPVGMGMPVQQQQPQPYPFMFSPQTQQQTPFNPFGTPFGIQQPRQQMEQFEEYSEKRARARRKEEMEEEEHKLRMAKLEAEIKAMTQPKKEPSNLVSILEPMRDAEGNLMRDSEGNILFRKITGPSDQVRHTSTEDPEIRFLSKLEKYKNLLKPELNETKVKALIQESLPKKEVKPLTEEDVKKAAREAALNVVAVTTKKDEEERRHRELLNAIRSSEGSKLVEGYKSDTYRFMGQGMNKLADVIEKKEPVKVIIQGAEKLLGTAPPEKTVEPEAREGIFKRIKKEFVAEE